MLLAVNWNNGAYVFVTVIVLIIVCALTVFLFLRVKRDYRNYRDEIKLIMDNVMTKSEIVMAVTSYINKIPKDMFFGLILIDFDKFSEIFDAYGEVESKKILEKSISNIHKVLPAKVQIGRYDKDEFLVLVRGDYSKNEIVKLANKIKEAADTPVKMFNGNEANQHTSISIAYYPFHGRSIKQLFNSLSLANYIAKKQGGDTVVQYSDEMDKKEGENVQYYNEIKSAIENKQFMLYYQPIINIRSKEIYGFEALLRWQHPEHGLLPPAKFINILEQSGDINWVGIWGIEALIKEYFNLRKLFPTIYFKLSMNLSPKQLTNENLIMDFQKLIKKYRVDTKAITIEIIEIAIFEKHEVVKSNILKLKELGFSIAVDGFEIDHNTLEKLQELPIDIIKLDKDFLLDDESSYVKERYAEMLIDYALISDKEVIFEGIEDYTMLQKALNFKIELAQGYYLSKPLSEEDLIKYIKDKKNLDEKIDGKFNTLVEVKVDDLNKVKEISDEEKQTEPTIEKVLIKKEEIEEPIEVKQQEETNFIESENKEIESIVEDKAIEELKVEVTDDKKETEEKSPKTNSKPKKATPKENVTKKASDSSNISRKKSSKTTDKNSTNNEKSSS